MASESLATDAAEQSIVKSLPKWYNRREVTFRYSIPIIQLQPALTKFLVDYIEKKSNAIGVAVKYHEPDPSMIRRPQMSVQILLLDNWTPWSSMPLDWTESFDSIINEALQEAVQKGLLPSHEIWTISAPNSSRVRPDKPVQSLQAFVKSESLPSDVAKQSENFVCRLPVVREVTFTTLIRPDQQQPLSEFVEEQVRKFGQKTSDCILVYAKFKLTDGGLLQKPQSQMTVAILLLQDWEPPVPVPSDLEEYYCTIIGTALHDALQRGLLPKDETWFIGASGIWRASLPQLHEPAQGRHRKDSVASERLTSEGVSKQSFPIPSTDREVSFWIGIIPDQQSGLVEFVKKHIHEQYGAFVRATAEFMYPKGLLAQNQMIVTISILGSWRPPPPAAHSERANPIDSIINETLLAAVAERRLPLLESWTISDPGGWGIMPVEPVQSRAVLPPMASVVFDPSIVQRTIIFVLEVNFEIPISADRQRRNLIKFLATDIKVKLLLANAEVTVQFMYSRLLANKMMVTIRLWLDSKVPRGPQPGWPNIPAMVEQALREALKRGLLPKGETWELTLSYPLHPRLGDGEGSIDASCHILHSLQGLQDRMVHLTQLPSP